ncbi:TPA: phage tail protein [Pseudomonas aeruginosa]
MSIETTIASLVKASNDLTSAVTGQLGKIETKLSEAFGQFTTWRQSVQAKDINGRAQYTQLIDLTGLSTNIFYPVWWTMPGNEEGESSVIISRLFSRDSELAPVGAGIIHIAGLNLQIEGCGYPWNGDANYLAVKRVSQTYRETVRQVKFGMLSVFRKVTGTKPLYYGAVDGQTGDCAVASGCYLRGGLSYTVTKSFLDPVKYSRVDSEVLVSEVVGTDNEIAYYVKPYQATDPILGTAYEESRIAYTQDLDKRYAAKGA